MSVSGSLKTMNFPELLQWIKFAQKTGSLIFESHGIVKKIFFENGMIVSGSSNDPREYLGQVLICFGLLNEEQLTQAFQRQKKTKSLLGKILSKEFDLKEKDILKGLRIKIEETVYGLFLWEHGSFIFHDSLSELKEHDRLEASITIDQVLFEGARRVDEWREFRRIFPNDEVVFQKKEGNKELGDLKGDFLVQKVYENIDGKKSIQRILLDTHVPEYRGLEAFGKLYWGDCIEPTKKDKGHTKKKNDGSKRELKEAAREFQNKNYSEAYNLLENFLLANPDDDEAHTLFKLVREAYLKELYEVCQAQAVPELTMDFSELNEHVFGSKEGYLASRINGEWDVKSLMMISPLGELDSLRIFKRLYDEGIIRFRNVS